MPSLHDCNSSSASHGPCPGRADSPVPEKRHGKACRDDKTVGRLRRQWDRGFQRGGGSGEEALWRHIELAKGGELTEKARRGRLEFKVLDVIPLKPFAWRAVSGSKKLDLSNLLKGAVRLKVPNLQSAGHVCCT